MASPASVAAGALTLAALFVVAPLPAQKPRRAAAEASWRIDPYDGGSNHGPFPWGDGRTSEDLRNLLAGSRLRFLETDHFRIGSALGPRSLPGSQKDKVRVLAELRKLRKKLKEVPRKPHLLDPWLLVHLYAQRLEELYADFQSRLGVKDTDFPAAGIKSPMGRGPYLGREEKFVVLLLEREGDLARYQKVFCDLDQKTPYRHWFPNTDNLGYAVAAECHRGVLADDGIMHCNVVFATVLNMIDGYRDFDPIGKPTWFKEGLAHWYRRQLNPRNNNFSYFDDNKAGRFENWMWYGKVRGRTRFNLDPPFDELMLWHEPWKLDLNQHTMIWSRVEFLMEKHPEGLRPFMDRLTQERILVHVNTPDVVRRWHDEALRMAYGFDSDQFTARWRKHVLATYQGKDTR